MKKLYLTLAAVVAGIGLSAPAGAQPNVNCTGTLLAGTYNNVNVPQNATCVISVGVTVEGNVTVAAGAAFVAIFSTIIDGSVSAKDAAEVVVSDGSTAMNINIVGTAAVELVSVTVGGNVQISGAPVGSFIEIDQNVVTGNVTDQGNNTAGSSNIIGANTIGGNLVCVGNTPAPVDGGAPNSVGGHKVGQCAGL